MEVTRKGNVLVRIHTDEGISGIGEAGYSVDFHPMLSAIIENILKPLLVGQDPTFIAMIWQSMFEATHKWGRRGLETYAISGIDIALWDILGKASGKPIYKLLGGYRRKVDAYAAPSLKMPKEVAADCETALNRGFKAIKLWVGFDPGLDEEIVKTARTTVGDDVGLMVDANMAYDYKTAVDMANILYERYGILWLEEPVLSRSLYEYYTSHAKLANKTNVPLSGGECLFTRYEFVPIFEHKAFDIIQPDATGVGGISESSKISAMSSAYGISFIPHIACSSGTGVGLAANLQVIGASAHTPFVEYDLYDDSPLQNELLEEPLRSEDGCVQLSDKPGLGVELNEAAVEKYRI